ncbi:MAG: neutral/alkaline non-lysosomal ceramidase N-terminal domain-containing protein [Kiritimatiellae bacterium]|nr:neutral/alkaline non-lysosomal ceramidase N-terminal domain-containing protein [Kiritimatiellia bacterium]MDD5519815.1 neutral/alkaline non-lysosomal ceramidase N-terminal domain-containing protein [Kiritimatiellia bacterium]
MKNNIGNLLLVVLAVLFYNQASGAADAWKAGVAKVKITPDESIWMAGYSSRDKSSEGVRQDLFAKALALQDGAGKPSVLVTLDLVGIDREMVDVITQKCSKQFGITREQLLFNISHTHSGPVAGTVLMPMYKLTPERLEVVRRYSEGLINKTVSVIGASLKDLVPVTLQYKQGIAGFAANRRRVSNRSLPQVVDHDVPVLKICHTNGTLHTVVVGYSCHATCLSDFMINGDWPGYAQEEIEKAHPGTTAMFVQGCGADCNPLPRRKVELCMIYGKIIAAAVEEVLGRPMIPLNGPMKTAFEYVDVPFQTLPTREELETRLKDKNEYKRIHARYLLDTLDKEGKLPSCYPYPVQVWQFGPKLKLIALAGEVVVDYSLRLKAQHGWDTTWVAGYSNDILAYIPSLRVLKEGGYEGGEAMIYFGRPCPFTEAVEEIIVEKVDQLVKRTTATVTH